MDRKTLERLVRSGKISPGEVLAQTGVDSLDETLTMLRRHCSAKEICAALMERIAKAPLSEFETLKTLYFRYCGTASAP